MFTLGDYRGSCVKLFGKDSASVKFFDKKIAEQGEDERVVAHPAQMAAIIKHLEGEETLDLVTKASGRQRF